MPDRPIIFSAPMVLALLGGRKTQTRRLAKVRAGLTTGDLIAHGEKVDGGYRATREMIAPPRFNVGDRLWVRERHWHRADGPGQIASIGKSWDKSTSILWADNGVDAVARSKGYRLRPSIHMPRWASRLTLTVTDVRVQRLQDISEADAIAEGLLFKAFDVESGDDMEIVDGWSSDRFHAFKLGVGETAVDGYRTLWNSLHGKPGERWDDNPWIVALTFTVERRNIDEASK